jgi:hypothetical protein
VGQRDTQRDRSTHVEIHAQASPYKRAHISQPHAAQSYTHTHTHTHTRMKSPSDVYTISISRAQKKGEGRAQGKKKVKGERRNK